LRDSFLRACLALGVTTVLITEVLSPLHMLARGPLLLAWLVVLPAAALGLGVRPKFTRIAIRPVEAALTLVAGAMVAVVAFTCWLSPPNSADAMAYHMPRVFYWAQAGSVAFFPTPYFNQISLQPMAEYCMLQTYLFSGGDHFVNLVTGAAFLGSLVAVSALAGELGAGGKGQAFAVLFCATLPNGILQASGAKNEWMLALWLLSFAYFAARENAPAAGFALGLALFTKATAYLLAPPLLLAILLIRRPRLGARSLVWITAGVLAINAPQYLRNLQLNGSPMGYDSAQGDGQFRWRNEHPGVKSMVSNLIRHTSEQLGDRRAGWNQAVFRTALALHSDLGLDPNDPATTWPYAKFAPPVNSNQEADANNRWHLLLVLLAAIFVAATRRRTWILYAAGLLGALLLYCFYLKWQPYMARLELPLFVLAAPLGGAFLEALRPVALPLLACLFLVVNSRLPLLQNWTRPLQGAHSLLKTSRDDNYFRDMIQWDVRSTYLPSIELAARSGCTTVGIDISQDQVEYPFLAILRERNPAIRFVHTGVENASARYAPSNAPRPCVVLCPDCVGLPHKLELYRDYAPPVEFARFLVFMPRRD
jgi:hypothetical protein